MNLTVSDVKRMAIENRLIDAALEAFKQRADIVGKNMNASGYRCVEVNIGTSA